MDEHHDNEAILNDLLDICYLLTSKITNKNVVRLHTYIIWKPDLVHSLREEVKQIQNILEERE